MNTVLWAVQILLALVFATAGVMKLVRSKEKLATNMAWVDGFESGHIKLIGALEVLGALGLILPAVTGILPILTPLAALGLALTMVGAIITHLRRQEYTHIIGPVILMLLSLFVAYGRFVLLPL